MNWLPELDNEALAEVRSGTGQRMTRQVERVDVWSGENYGVIREHFALCESSE